MVALKLIEDHERDGTPLPRGRWRVRYAHGDHLDLRRKNLEFEPAQGRKGKYYEVWDLQQRRKIVAEGRSPNAEFRRRRKEAKGPRPSQTRKAAKPSNPREGGQ